ncbi:MAG: PfkB family carbohydrate kinase [Janthinobacterium lividum]
MENATIIAVGSINADFEARAEAPPEVETRLASQFERLAGGKAANIAYLARHLGRPARLFGCVGDDELAEQALAPLRAAGVDLSGVARVTGVGTAVSMIELGRDGKKRILLANNANDQWPDGAYAGLLKAIETAPAASVLVVDYEIPARVADAAIRAAHARGLPIVVDPSFADRVDPGMLALMTAIAPNHEEAGSLLQQEANGRAANALDAAREAALALTQRGVRLACIKLPDGGCVFAVAGGSAAPADAENIASGAGNADLPSRAGAADARASAPLLYLVPAVDMQVVDTTGAGDAFTGALAIALTAPASADSTAGILDADKALDAVVYAVAASHLSITRFGSQPAYPDDAAIRALLPRIRRGVQRLDRG